MSAAPDEQAAPSTGTTRPVSTVLPMEIVAELDRLVAVLSAVPGAAPTRASIMRAVIEAGLPVFTASLKKP